MLARTAPVARRQTGDLFERIGEVLRAQGLGPEPENYAFAYRLLGRDDEMARQALARLRVDGIRLTRDEIAAMGGAVAGAPEAARSDTAAAAPSAREEQADRLVEQTRVQAETVAGLARAMHDQTRDFGRDLAQSAAALDEGDVLPAAGVARLTEAMLGRVSAAESRLQQAIVEADALRTELAAAQTMARRDALTGLANRRAFDEAFAVPAPGGRCLAMIDIDRFKAINDGFGHPVGDRVLSAVARILAEECAGHLVSRQGGEEFGVLIGDGDIDAATDLLERAREAVGNRRFKTREGDKPLGRITFSAGVVAVGVDESADSARARADALLYRAKEDGRDRVIAG